MLKKMLPKMYIESFNKLNLDFLIAKGIKLIICDIDNTLVSHDEPYPNDDVKKFIEAVFSKGLNIVLISNNNKNRVSLFAKELELDYFYSAKKPLSYTYKKIRDRYNISFNNVAAVGDQLLTDILGANRLNIYSVLTEPLFSKDLIYTRANRVLENIVYKYFESKKLLVKGEFYE